MLRMREAAVEMVSPDVLVKGEDYADKPVVGREWVESHGGQVVLEASWRLSSVAPWSRLSLSELVAEQASRSPHLFSPRLVLARVAEQADRSPHLFSLLLLFSSSPPLALLPLPAATHALCPPPPRLHCILSRRVHS